MSKQAWIRGKPAYGALAVGHTRKETSEVKLCWRFFKIGLSMNRLLLIICSSSGLLVIVLSVAV